MYSFDKTAKYCFRLVFCHIKVISDHLSALISCAHQTRVQIKDYFSPPTNLLSQHQFFVQFSSNKFLFSAEQKQVQSTKSRECSIIFHLSWPLSFSVIITVHSFQVRRFINSPIFCSLKTLSELSYFPVVLKLHLLSRQASNICFAKPTIMQNSFLKQSTFRD